MFENLGIINTILSGIGGAGAILALLWKFGFKWYIKNVLKKDKLEELGVKVGKEMSKYGNKYVKGWEKYEEEVIKESIADFTEGICTGLDWDDDKKKKIKG